MSSNQAFIDSRAARLRQARQAAGYDTARDAADAMGISRTTYYGHENGRAGFKSTSAIKYAKRFRVSLEWLETGRGEGPASQPSNSPKLMTEIVTRPLLGFVQAGVWQEEPQNGEFELGDIPVPADRIIDGADQFWFEVVGDSVDKFVAGGGKIFCTSVWDWARDTDDLFRRANGKLVIAERRRSDGTFQRTCKRLVVNGSGPALHTASTHPRWMNEAPIQPNEDGETVEVRLVAVVTDLMTPAP